MVHGESGKGTGLSVHRAGAAPSLVLGCRVILGKILPLFEPSFPTIKVRD